MRNFAVCYAHSAISKQTLVAPINAGPPPRVGNDESERKQKRHGKKIGKASPSIFKSRHSKRQSALSGRPRDKRHGRSRLNHYTGPPYPPTVRSANRGIFNPAAHQRVARLL